MNLVDRVKSILLQPGPTWAAIEAEEASAKSLYTGYLMWLAAIPAVCGFIGMSLFGFSIMGMTVRVPLLSGLGNMVTSYVLSLIGVYVLALIVDALAPSFGGTRSPIQALKLVVYASTAALLGGVFSLLPALSMLGLLAALYSIYLVYTGLPVLMKNPAEKSLGYTALVIVAGVVLGIVIAAVAALFQPRGPALGGALSITTPQGKVTLDTATGQAAVAAMGAQAGAQGSIAAQALKAGLPERLIDLPRTSMEALDSRVMDRAMGQARADYRQGDKRLQLEIMDGGISGLAQSAGMMLGEKETEDYAEKSWQSGGRIMQEEYRKDGRSAEARVILKNSLIVRLIGSNMPIAQVRSALAQIDLAMLEKLERSKP